MTEAPVHFMLTGSYVLKGNELSFDGRRCFHCPIEERYTGQIRGERLELHLSGEVRQSGGRKLNQLVSAVFVKIALPDDASDEMDFDRRMDASELSALDSLEPATIRPPSADMLEAIRSAKTIRLTFAIGASHNMFGVHKMFTAHPLVETVDHLSRRAGLTVVAMGDADLTLTVDRLWYFDDHTTQWVRELTVRTEISGRISVSAKSTRSIHQTSFKASQKGPWFPIDSKVLVPGNPVPRVREVRYREGPIVGDAFTDGFVRTVKAILRLRAQPAQ